MADLVTISNALAARITAGTGLRALGQARDTVSPPCAVVLPGNPLITYGATTDGTATMNLFVIVVITDAAPAEKTQRALDSYLGIGAGETASIPGAIMADTSLGGTVHFCIPLNVSSYGRIEWAGVQYFGARLAVQLGVI